MSHILFRYKLILFKIITMVSQEKIDAMLQKIAELELENREQKQTILNLEFTITCWKDTCEEEVHEEIARRLQTEIPERIFFLQQESDEKQETINELELEIGWKKDEITSLNEEIADQQEEIANLLQLKIPALRQENVTLQNNMATLQQENTDQWHENMHLRQENMHLQLVINAQK